MTPLPEPLVPAEVDLNGYQFMPLYGHRLFGSEFNARCSDAAWRAGVTLWWAAWNQVPAASLPDDDIALCRLADLGRDLKTWRKLRDDALHGFVKCSDGRLYHKALCEYALEAWAARVRERERKRRWREGRERSENRDGDGDKSITKTGTETGTQAGQGRDVPAERDRERERDSERDRERELKEEGGGQPSAAPAAQQDLLEVPVDLDRTPLRAAVDAWNALAKRSGLPAIQRLTEARRRALRNRLAEAGGIDGWNTALAKVEASKFLNGANDRGWRADFDFVVREAPFTKLMEGKYDDHQPRDGDQFRNGFAQLIAEGRV